MTDVALSLYDDLLGLLSILLLEISTVRIKEKGFFIFLLFNLNSLLYSQNHDSSLSLFDFQLYDQDNNIILEIFDGTKRTSFDLSLSECQEVEYWPSEDDPLKVDYLMDGYSFVKSSSNDDFFGFSISSDSNLTFSDLFQIGSTPEFLKAIISKKDAFKFINSGSRIIVSYKFNYVTGEIVDKHEDAKETVILSLIFHFSLDKKLQKMFLDVTYY